MIDNAVQLPVEDAQTLLTYLVESPTGSFKFSVVNKLAQKLDAAIGDATRRAAEPPAEPGKRNGKKD